MASGRGRWRGPDLFGPASIITAQDLAREALAASAPAGAAAPSPAPLRPRAQVRTLPLRSLALRSRPSVAGKFLQVGSEKLWVRGVT